MPVKLQSADRDHEDDARIEVVPLIDIMFFLLASFMMVSLSMTQIHRVNLKLPVSTSAVADNKVPPVHLAIDAHGIATWDAVIVTPTEITARLIQMKPDENTRVLIGADRDCRHQHVLAVLDAVRAAKVAQVSFESKPLEP
jgi:biopolymer transport protein ExbD